MNEESKQPEEENRYGLTEDEWEYAKEQQWGDEILREELYLEAKEKLRTRIGGNMPQIFDGLRARMERIDVRPALPAGFTQEAITTEPADMFVKRYIIETTWRTVVDLKPEMAEDSARAVTEAIKLGRARLRQDVYGWLIADLQRFRAVLQNIIDADGGLTMEYVELLMTAVVAEIGRLLDGEYT